MIVHELKSRWQAGEAVTREFISLMDASFTFYKDTRNQFFQQLPHQLGGTDLAGYVGSKLKPRLFNREQCEGIPENLKALRRVLIRVEDLLAQETGAMPPSGNLARLGALAEKVETLYQKHWEYFRYQEGLPDAELVGLVLEVDRISAEWDSLLGRYSAVRGLLETLEGQPTPEGHIPLRIAYHQAPPAHYSVHTIGLFLDFLQSAYGFIAAVHGLDTAEAPLQLQQVEVADPVAIVLAVPSPAVTAYRRFLQHLFLKDMLKREALLKVVFEAILKDFADDKRVAPAKLQSFQKELSSRLKNLPNEGQFSISDRNFPEDGIRVLQEFTSGLDEKKIKYDALFGSTEKRSGRSKAPKTDAVEAPGRPSQTELTQAEGRNHLRILTDNSN